MHAHLSTTTLSPPHTRPCFAWHLLPPIPIPQEYHRRDVQASGGRLRPSNEEAKSRRSGVNRRPPPTWAPMYPHCVMSRVLQPKCDLHRIAYTCTGPLPCLWEQCAGLCAGSSRLQSLGGWFGGLWYYCLWLRLVSVPTGDCALHSCGGLPAASCGLKTEEISVPFLCVFRQPQRHES